MQMKKQGHWFNFEFVTFEDEIEKINYFEVRMFVNSAREGIHLIRQEYPGVNVYEVQRLDSSKKRESQYIEFQNEMGNHLSKLIKKR